MTVEERLANIERRLSRLERANSRFEPLGPGPQSDAELAKERDKIVDRILADPPTNLSPPPVDRTKRVLTDGSPVTSDHREIDPATGMQRGYVVLSPEERAKGFVRPVRQVYTHKTCGTDTHMGLALAETYARDPGFYSGTFCCHCKTHLPLNEFVWKGTSEQVGS